jgi:hypothetical protein
MRFRCAAEYLIANIYTRQIKHNSSERSIWRSYVNPLLEIVNLINPLITVLRISGIITCVGS